VSAAAPATRSGSAPEVVLVDTGVANLGSVLAALSRIGIAASLSTDIAAVRAATHVILPGVGAARPAMQRLRATGLAAIVPTLTQPVLGICLGMQLMFAHSEEGDEPCLGIFPGSVRRLVASPGVRIPHMGWNRLVTRRDHALTRHFGAEPYAYFVHSYAAPELDETLVACEHGQAFSAVVSRGNFHGAQFHPERSAAVGAQLLRNFLSL
jgi:imidazole glycerol-phosphate synthase subunit HisH